MSQREVLDVAQPEQAIIDLQSFKSHIAKLATTHLSHFLFRCQIEAHPLAQRAARAAKLRRTRRRLKPSRRDA